MKKIKLKNSEIEFLNDSLDKFQSCGEGLMDDSKFWKTWENIKSKLNE
jgi:hypothetical protein